MLRDYISRLSQTRFWISKWVVATAILIAIFVAGIFFLLRQDIDFDTFLNYFALGLLIFVVVTLFYVIIAIHDVPYEIAKKRDHPHQDAIHAAGWVSLFTLHAIWPFLWIWAMLFRPDRGWGFQHGAANVDASAVPTMLDELIRRVEALEARAISTALPKPAERIEERASALQGEPVEKPSKRGGR
jgi:Protein of unknown function (DUF3302)